MGTSWEDIASGNTTGKSSKRSSWENIASGNIDEKKKHLQHEKSYMKML